MGFIEARGSESWELGELGEVGSDLESREGEGLGGSVVLFKKQACSHGNHVLGFIEARGGKSRGLGEQASDLDGWEGEGLGGSIVLLKKLAHSHGNTALVFVKVRKQVQRAGRARRARKRLGGLGGRRAGRRCRFVQKAST